MGDGPLHRYWLLIDEEIAFAWNEQFPGYTQKFRVLIFDGGHARPYIVLARNALTGGRGKLEWHALDAAAEVYMELGIPLHCMVWVNWLPGRRGSYSRRAERFAYVDLF
jgi:hypothetical protein